MKDKEELVIDGILKEHNIPTYQAIETLFNDGANKVGLVQATGTGKSYLVYQWLYDNVLTKKDKKAIILTPLYGIVEQFKTLFDEECKKRNIAYENVQIINYERLKAMDDVDISRLNYDYIILDEFHGLGASGRGGASRKLLEANPQAKVLGTSATPIRYLDNKRDMGYELFNDNVVYGVNLKQAIQRGVLPQPHYVMATYSYSDSLDKLEEKIDRVKDKTQREMYQSTLNKLRRRAAEAQGLSSVFEQKIEKKNGKFIAFCSNIERLNELYDEIHDRGLFSKVNKKIRLYQVTYKNGRDNAKAVIKKFEEDTDNDSLKIILAVDMFNEGIHVKDVDGCFMFRPTISPRVYLQQLGRVLSVQEDKKNPLVFDIVNNIECLSNIAEAFDLDNNFNNEDGNSIDDLINSIPFKIDGDDLNLNLALIKLDTIVSQIITSPKQYLEAAKRYVDDFGNLNVPDGYIDEESELKIGSWLGRIRRDYLKDRRTIPSEIIDKLLELDKNFLTYTKNNLLQLKRLEALEQLKEFVKEYGLIPVPRNIRNGKYAKYKKIIALCSTIKSDNVTGEIRDSILAINPNALKTKEDIGRERDIKALEQLKEFVKERGFVPIPSNQEEDSKYSILIAAGILARYANTERAKNLKKAILEINSNALSTLDQMKENNDSIIFEQLEQFVSRNGLVPVPFRATNNSEYSILINACNYCRYNSSKNSKKLEEAILAINPNAFRNKEDQIEKIVEELKEFIKENGYTPVPTNANKNPQYSNLINACNLCKHSKNKSGDYVVKIKGIIEDINPNALKTQEYMAQMRYREAIRQLEEFVKENGCVPVPSESYKNSKYKVLISVCKYLKDGNEYEYDSGKLKEEILKINPNALKTQKEAIDERDAKVLEELEEFVRERGCVPVPTMIEWNPKYPTLIKTCVLIKAGRSSSKIREEILSRNPNALKSKKEVDEERYIKALEELKEFVKERGCIPVPYNYEKNLQYETLIRACAFCKYNSSQYARRLKEAILKINPNALNKKR